MKNTLQFLRLNWVYFAIILIALIGVAFLYYDMNWGPWVYSDSVAYIVSARYFAAGEGLGMPGPDGGFMPLTLHPPFFSLLLSGFITLGIHAYTAIIFINLLCFAGSIILLGGGLYYLTGSSGAALSAAALTLISPVLIANFDGAMTEPLYIFFTLGSLIILGIFLKKKTGPLWIIAAILSALAMLTRFVGIVNIIAGALIILLLLESPLKRSFFITAGYGIIAGLPSMGWMLHTSTLSGQAASRSVVFPENLIQSLALLKKLFMEVFVTWVPYNYQLLPGWRAKALAVYLIGFITLMLSVISLRKKTKGDSDETKHFGQILISAWIFVFCYATVLSGSFLFASVQPDINQRMLSPLQPVLFLLVPGTLFFTIKRWRLHPAFQVVPIILVIIAASAFWPATQRILIDRHNNGSGYTSPMWRDSPLIDAARELPEDTPLISNQPAAVLLYLDLFPYDLDLVLGDIVQSKNHTFGKGETQLEKLFKEENAALILFEPYFTDDIYKILGENSANFKAQFTEELTPYQQTIDGGIYFYRP